MVCLYCNKKTKYYMINWEGLKGYSICKKCHKKGTNKNKFFIEKQLKELNSKG